MRDFGAQAAAEIAATHTDIVPGALTCHRTAAVSLDSAAVHGALCAVFELTERIDVPCAVEIATSVSPRLFHVLGAALVLSAACRAAAGGSRRQQAAHVQALWSLVNAAGRRPEGDVHKAVASLVRALRSDPSVDAYINHASQWGSFAMEEQRCTALALGALGETHADRVAAILVDMLQSQDAEVRANAAASLGAVGHYASQVETVVLQLTQCLRDYAVDERGDVGSWVRVASMRALGDVLVLKAVNFDLLQGACTGMTTQLVERMDTVRSAAAAQLVRIARVWQVAGRDILLGLPLAHLPCADHFEHSVHLLSVPEYRPSVLIGLSHTIGGRSEALANRAAAALLAHMHDPKVVFGGIAQLAAASVRDNRDFVALMQTAYILLQDGRPYEGIGGAITRLVRLAAISPDKIKSVPRLLACAKLCVYADECGWCAAVRSWRKCAPIVSRPQVSGRPSCDKRGRMHLRAALRAKRAIGGSRGALAPDPVADKPGRGSACRSSDIRTITLS